jgi:asparagine synthase (glutamine-hydrolysing)
VPEPIVRRFKQPYRAPDSQSFFDAGEPLPYVKELLSASNLRRTGYFDAEAVARLIAKCRSGQALGAGDNMALVGVSSTLLLHEHFFTGQVAHRLPVIA